MKRPGINATMLLALTAVMLVTLSYEVGAQRATMRPTVVATVNLTRVLERLDQRAEAEVRVNQLKDQVVAEAEQRQAALERIVEQRSAIEDSDERQALRDQLELMRKETQAWSMFKDQELDVEVALSLKELYHGIRDAIGELAETNGYDMVVVDDSGGELDWSKDSSRTREVQVLRQIHDRRLMYVRNELDISDELVERMNNAYRINASSASGTRGSASASSPE